MPYIKVYVFSFAVFVLLVALNVRIAQGVGIKYCA